MIYTGSPGAAAGDGVALVTQATAAGAGPGLTLRLVRRTPIQQSAKLASGSLSSRSQADEQASGAAAPLVN